VICVFIHKSRRKSLGVTQADTQNSCGVSLYKSLALNAAKEKPKCRGTLHSKFMQHSELYALRVCKTKTLCAYAIILEFAAGLSMRQCSWLRHYITSLKVAGSIPDAVIRFFNSRTMSLGSTQPLTEMSTRNLPGGKERPVCKADNLTAIYKPTV
jgi:hypothetical protein